MEKQTKMELFWESDVIKNGHRDPDYPNQKICYGERNDINIVSSSSQLFALGIDNQ